MTSIKIVYHVEMVDPHCPEEKIDMGLYETLDKAGRFIERERVQYSERMEWFINEKQYHGPDE